METKIIEVKIELDESFKLLLKLKLGALKYCDLVDMYVLFHNEIKNREKSIPTISNPNGNYNPEKK